MNNETLDNKGRKIGPEIGNLSLIEFTNKLSKSSDEVSKLRPFISEQSWILMHAYTGFIGRTVYLLIDGYKKKEIKNWKQDTGVKHILSTILTDNELNYILKLEFHAYDSMLQFIENKILNELKKMISSDDLTENSLSELKKINQILGQKTNNT